MLDVVKRKLERSRVSGHGDSVPVRCRRMESLEGRTSGTTMRIFGRDYRV